MLSPARTCSYAVPVPGRLARNVDDRYRAEQISASVGVPKPFLAKVLHSLAPEGLVITKRGYRGEYSLPRQPSQINLLDIIRSVEGPLEERCVLDSAPWSDEHACGVHDFGEGTRSAMVRELEAVSLEARARWNDLHAASAPAGGATETSSLVDQVDRSGGQR